MFVINCFNKITGTAHVIFLKYSEHKSGYEALLRLPTNSDGVIYYHERVYSGVQNFLKLHGKDLLVSMILKINGNDVVDVTSKYTKE